jgi:hypothetical protein
MTLLDRFAPLSISLIATPFLLLLGLWSAGAGHGDYILVPLLFPFPIAVGFLTKPLFTCPEYGDCYPRDGIVLLLSILQFPIYGVVLSFINKRLLLVVLLACFHIAFFAAFWIYFGTLGFW